jgi:hypothetical protein
MQVQKLFTKMEYEHVNNRSILRQKCPKNLSIGLHGSK